jgi:DNA-binding LytR/AlgR family response regulator
MFFTTAYSKYALEGYSLDVIDYLLKPIPFERFFQAVSKAQDYLTYRESNVAKQNVDEAKEKHPYIFVKADYKIIKICYEDILYIEGMKEYVRIHTADKKITTHQSLQKLTEVLPANIFIRVHKSFIVNMNKIDSIDNTVIIINDEVIGIGRSYREAFFKRINERMVN